MPLTDSIARNAKPAAKTIRMFDRDGLYLEVSPRDGKGWRLKYRYAGMEKRVSLGVYPEVDLKRARARTIEARQLLDSGVDPSENRRAAKAAHMDSAANSAPASCGMPNRPQWTWMAAKGATQSPKRTRRTSCHSQRKRLPSCAN
jgi:Arm DNA-binding domain